MAYLIVFAITVVMFFLAWGLTGLFVLPVFGPEMVTLCFVQGGGERMEQRVRSFGWFRDGKATGGRLVLVDCGLSEQGLQAAQILRSRFDWVEYCPRPALEDYIDLLELANGEHL